MHTGENLKARLPTGFSRSDRGHVFEVLHIERVDFGALGFASRLRVDSVEERAAANPFGRRMVNPGEGNRFIFGVSARVSGKPPRHCST